MTRFSALIFIARALLDVCLRQGYLTRMTIGILLCGDIPGATLQAEFGPYNGMIRRLLGSRPASVFDVQNGQLPRSTSYLRGLRDHRLQMPEFMIACRWINDLMVFLRNVRGAVPN